MTKAQLASNNTNNASILEEFKLELNEYITQNQINTIEIEEFFEEKYNKIVVEIKDGEYLVENQEIMYSISTFENEVYEVEKWDGTIATNFESGNGSQESPHIINTASQLAYLSELSRDEEYDTTDKYYKVEKNIVLNFNVENEEKLTFEPIGEYSAKAFKGNFDGNNNVIYGLYNVSGENHIGLFASINSAEVKNIKMQDLYIYGQSWLGGISGYAIAATWSDKGIKNCEVSGEIYGNGNQVGGIVGRFDGGTIENCKSFTIISGKNNIGGIVGVNAYWNILFNCVNYGNISANENYCGGISGHAQASIKNSYNLGNVTGTTNVGGIEGYAVENSWGSTKYCYSIGTITGDELVGGIIGTGGANLASLYYYGDNIGAVEGLDIENSVRLITENELYSKEFWIENGYSEETWYLGDGEMPKLLFEIEN